MKTNTIYESRASGRQWRKREDGVIETRGDFPAEVWREQGQHGVPSMREQDVEHYISSGAFMELK